MNREINHSIDAITLRQQAEQQLAAEPECVKATPSDEKRLIHELQVHQIELEMLNANLRHSQAELEQSWANYVDLYDFAPVGYLTITADDVILNANLTASKLLGVEREALINKILAQFIVADNQDMYYLQRKRKLQIEAGAPQAIEVNFIKANGVTFWARMEMNRMDGVKDVQLLRVVISDISQQKANDDYLRLAAVMFQSAQEGVMVTDSENRIELVNPAFTQLTGYSPAEVLGQVPTLPVAGRQDGAFYQSILAEVDSIGYWQGEIINRRKNGEIYPQVLNIRAVRNQHQKVTHYVSVFSDISLLNKALERLDYQANHDPLTGLPNRRLLFSRLQDCMVLCERRSQAAALLILGLDRFKDINEIFGHLVGDEILKKVAERLVERLSCVDTVAHLGGDEFVVLLKHLAHPLDAANVAADIIQALSEAFQLLVGTEVHIGVSIGISLCPEHGKNPEELLQRADTALYWAKEEGGCNYQYFSEQLTQAAVSRFSMEALLRKAIMNKELQVYYQPQVDIGSGAIVGAEALLRWPHPDKGMIPPCQFIPVAEAIGLIGEIGEWVLSETCRQGQQWLEAGLPPLKLAVNLSPYQFRNGDIASTVIAIVNETGFPAKYLELELTETAMMERESVVLLQLERLRALGVTVAIDDFGTGYSSLSYLKQFPLDILKIDKSFIEEVELREDDKQIVATIIVMAHTLHLKVLAEGVETEEQLNFLKAQGCDYYQGYYKSPAVTAKAFAGFFKESLN